MRGFGVLVAATILLLAFAAPTSAATFSLKFVSLSSPIKAGAYATAVVTTTHNAKCGIVVAYKTTMSHAKGLVTKTAPSNGRLIWQWKTGTTTTPGTWRVTVTCKLGTKTLSAWKTMTIVKHS
jgi:hypothetical protein